MKLPHYSLAIVSKIKIVDYLLAETHIEGNSKARFFHRLGFSEEKWDEMATALRAHAFLNEVTKSVSTQFGTRYVVDGPFTAPSGRMVELRSVWFIPLNERLPSLTTAYPLKGKKLDKGTR